MADCGCLPNAAIILKNTRRMYADEYWVQRAADAIEALLADNAKLKSAFDECYAANEDLFAKLETMKAERDAAIADLKDLAYCTKCLHENKYPINNPCCVCYGNMWEWRGIKEEEYATD